MPEFVPSRFGSEGWFTGRTIRSGPGRPSSAEGTRRHGERFNRRRIPAFYTSLAPLTAIRDAEPIFDALDEERHRALSVGESDLACLISEADMLAGSVPASQALATA